MAALKIFRKKEKLAKPAAASVSGGGKAAVSMSSHIVSPHITEKATDLAVKNQYVFIVSSRSTKNDIKRSVKQMYGVDVKSVRTVNVHSKIMHLGRIQGIKKGYKKAIVKVKEGQKIEILPT